MLIVWFLRLLLGIGIVIFLIWFIGKLILFLSKK
jgi:hypothetical protein